MSLERSGSPAKPAQAAASLFNGTVAGNANNGSSPLFGTLTRGFTNVLRELEQKKPQLDDLVRTADSLRESPIKQQIPAKVTQLREHWQDTSDKVLSRKSQLEELYVDNQELERKRREVEAWLSRMEGWRERMQPVSVDLLETQVREQKSFHAEVHQYKSRIEEFNNLTQELISSYPTDDTAKVKKIAESINQRYCLLTGHAMTRGKELHAGLTSANSFHGTLDELSIWMVTMENQLEGLEEEITRTGGGGRLGGEDVALDPHLDQRSQDLQDEIEKHREMYMSLNNTGKKLMSGLDNQEDATILHRRLEEMNQRWNYLKAKSIAIRSRIENTNEDWGSLLASLRELTEWVVIKEGELAAMAPCGGDENTIRAQQEETRNLRRQLYDKRPVVENKLLSGRQFLASEPAASDTSDSDMSRETESDSTRGSSETEADKAHLPKCIRREVAKLSDKWSSLLAQLEVWQRRLDDTLPKVHTFQASLEAVLAQLCDAEFAQKTLTANANTPDNADPNVFRNQLKGFSVSLAPLQRVVEDINDQASDFTTNNIVLSRQILLRLEDINTRWKLVQLGLDDQYKRLNEVRGKDRLPNTQQDFLSVAVAAPWARAISHNGVPYYINHSTETTHWDHPELVNTFKSLIQFNTIRFSAYRTAMKIRELQKRLSLHLLSLNVAIEAFDAHGLRGQNERMLDVSDIVAILSSLYETISAGNPTLVNVPLCLDLTLNWLLNVYDCQRSGQIRVLSLKVAITIMCKGALEEKYRYMFRLIADQQRRSNQRKLGLLLGDCIQVPRVLGEISAFGGINIEPSVRSCFEKAGDTGFIEALHFLNWMKQEPQSMVWLPVLHRFTAAESAVHQAKCNICKQNPILGFRYRCLKCFNFDMCQECFFAGKGGRYKNHKMTHPMQEYCTTTTSGEDVRDFTKLLRNKLMSRKSKKNSRLGYLPVQGLDPGEPPDSPSLSPGRSVSRQEMADRLDVLTTRLTEMDTRSGSDESASRQVTPQQHQEPTRVNGGSPLMKDEHSLIAAYCQKLSEGHLSHLIPESPMQVASEIDGEQRKELEHMILELEAENANLKEEYNHLKTVGASQMVTGTNQAEGSTSDAEMLAEAAMLREHRNRLENRMVILEEHNRQLESQLHKLKGILEPGGAPVNKTGTLNTKSVTASMLATDSPILPHKVNGSYTQQTPLQPPDLLNIRVPPAVPPRARETSLNRSQGANGNGEGLHGGSQQGLGSSIGLGLNPIQSGLATVKRNSMSRAEGQAVLEEAFRASTLSRRGGRQDAGDGRVPFRREASVPRATGVWSDSLPRKDLFANNTGSLPRRDKAGLGRPEPPPTAPKPQDQGSQGQQGSQGHQGQHGQQGGEPLRLDGGPQLNRDNPFRDTILGDKRSSTGNLCYFTDQFDNHPWENPELNQTLRNTARRRKSSEKKSGGGDAEGGDVDEEGPDPATTLQAMAGNVGKELNQLISMMNSEDAAEGDT